LATAEPVLGVTMTERHLDMLQLAGDLDLETRALLGDASDDLAAGRLHTPAVRSMVAAFNADGTPKLDKDGAQVMVPKVLSVVTFTGYKDGMDCEVLVSAEMKLNTQTGRMEPMPVEPYKKMVKCENIAPSEAILGASAEGEAALDKIASLAARVQGSISRRAAGSLMGRW
jgi:hypothetical protein